MIEAIHELMGKLSWKPSPTPIKSPGRWRSFQAILLQLSSEQNPGCLLYIYIGDNVTYLYRYRHYNKRL